MATVHTEKLEALNSAWEPTTADLTAPNVGTVWDLCLSVEYDRDQLVRDLADWLGSPDGLQVLDCACGSGFPALDLHRLGYNLTCTDASAFMLERFSRNARAAGIELEPLQARWEELGALYEERFDVVMCRGCSLIYAGTFESDADPDRSAMESSIESFVHCLRPGGRLYVDVPREEGLDDEDPPWIEHAPRTINGHRVEMRELTAKLDAGLRHWTVELRIDDASFTFERRSHYLPHAELANLLQDAGLEDVGRVDIAGEHYAVFSGRKA